MEAINANPTLPQGNCFPSTLTSILTAVDFDLFISNAILRVYWRAFLIGKIEAKIGIKVPTNNASPTAFDVGATEILTPKAPSRAFATKYNPSILIKIPATRAGITYERD